MNSLVGKFIGAWLHPWGTMQAVRDEGEQASITSSMIFIIVMGVISGIITAVMGLIFPPATAPATGKAFIWLAVIIVPLGAFIGSFIAAFLVWGLVDGLLHGTATQYKTAYRLLAVLAAFSPISSILGPLPKVGQWLALLIQLWGLIVMIQGIVIVRDTRPVRTWVVCGIIFGLLMILSVAARQAAQRNLGAGGLGGFEAGLGEDLGGNTATSDLDKQLQDLADKAKQGEGTAAPGAPESAPASAPANQTQKK